MDGASPKLVVISIFVIAASVVGGNWLANYLGSLGAEDTAAQTTQQAVIPVNPNAQIALSGSPLPSLSSEDVVVSLSYIDAADTDVSVTYQEDYGNGWQVQIESPDGLTEIMFIDGRYLARDSLDFVWQEIDESVATDIFDRSLFLLDEQQLLVFGTRAQEAAGEQCGAELCAVWEAVDEEQGELLTIRVSKSSRKISSATGLNELGLFNYVYSYEPVSLQAPADVLLPTVE